MKPAKDILYYDGQCPLCAKEIHFLQQQQQGTLAFTDIHLYQPDTSPVSRDLMLKRLHLLTAEKEWVTGLDATVKAWSHTRYGWLFRPLRWPLISPIADWAYTKWADKRYEKYYECNVCSQGDPNK